MVPIRLLVRHEKSILHFDVEFTVENQQENSPETLDRRRVFEGLSMIIYRASPEPYLATISEKKRLFREKSVQH